VVRVNSLDIKKLIFGKMVEASASGKSDSHCENSADEHAMVVVSNFIEVTVCVTQL
jgi:hypothetical protein